MIHFFCNWSGTNLGNNSETGYGCPNCSDSTQVRESKRSLAQLDVPVDDRVEVPATLHPAFLLPVPAQSHLRATYADLANEPREKNSLLLLLAILITTVAALVVAIALLLSAG